MPMRFFYFIEEIKHFKKKRMIDQENKNNTIIIEKGALDAENENKYKELKGIYQKTLDNINLYLFIFFIALFIS